MLLPTTINVVTEFPTEEAELGTLNYYTERMLKFNQNGILSTVDNPSAVVREWLLNSYADNVPSYAGMRTAQSLNQNVVFKGTHLNAAQRDRLYELGYNCVVHQPGIGPVIWDNSIAGTQVNLPALVTTVDYLISIDDAIRKNEGIPNFIMHYMNVAAQDLLARRHFYEYFAVWAGDNPRVLFEPSWFKRPDMCSVTVNVDGTIYADRRLSELVGLASVLYPEICKYEGPMHHKFLGRSIVGYY